MGTVNDRVGLFMATPPFPQPPGSANATSPTWHYGRLYPFSGISYEKRVQKKDPGNGTQSAIVPYIILVCPLVRHLCTPFLVFPEKSYKKIVQKKIPETGG